MKYDKYDWFYGAFDSRSAVNLLHRVNKDGCFLVRISSTKMHYVLTLFRCSGNVKSTHHFKILQSTSGRFHIDDEQVAFPTLATLIEDHAEFCRSLPCILKCTPEGPIKFESPAMEPCIRSSNILQDRKGPTAASRANIQRTGLPRSDNVWEIDLTELQLMDKIGEGSFGLVQQAKLRGSAMVAVKIVTKGAMSEAEFLEAVPVMADLKHPHIIRMCGVSIKQRPMIIAFEYMQHGSLVKYLIKNRTDLLNKHKSLLSICAQVSAAMAYLEGQKFVHGDLQAKNCLVGLEGIVKVADYGMSKFKGKWFSSGRDKFKPPESSKSFSSKSDVWDFGVLMWEVYTCGDVPNGNPRLKEPVNHVGRGYILDQPWAATADDYDMMTRCWALKPEKRPTFEKLNTRLRAMYSFM